MACASTVALSLLGSSYFIGWTISLLFVPRLADMYGRKKIFVVGMVLQVLVYFGVIFARSITFMTVMLGISGLINGVRNTLGYVYMMEFVSERHQTVVGTVEMSCETMVSVFGALYF